MLASVADFQLNVNETFKNIRISHRLVRDSRKCNTDLCFGFVYAFYIYRLVQRRKYGGDISEIP